jgi:hypothetical protein
MTGPWRTLALAAFGYFVVDLSSAQAQISVSGGRTVVVKPAYPVQERAPVFLRRRPWRERNPYFVARPVYPPAPPGTRPSISLEPFTNKYYPTENSYSPPIPVNPPTRIR